jgi:hypothetical protein
MTSMRQSRAKLLRQLIAVIAALASSGMAVGQGEQSSAPPGKPSAKPENPALPSPGQPGKATPQESSVQNPQLQRLTNAADKVLNRIQKEENDLYLRINYFEMPDRLNPNSYASKEEVAQWQGILQQLKEKHDLVAQLYADLEKNLDAELKGTGTSNELAEQFKKFVIGGFPWDEIEKKKKLIADFIDEQGKLLLFYEKNWGSWTTSTGLNEPEFKSASAASIYKRLRDQILSTSEQIEKEYKAMSE